uniref:Uncharacterized protein n=1 Tax=Tupiella akineta TaxID=160070 RepID=Q6UVV9_TUPAK|nr:hypothetical protein PsakpMp07 [Tupiella akineta]AAQ18716.1 hypothetical protein [Tupiella akineta]
MPQFAKAPSHFLPPKFVSLRTNCFCAAGKICSLHSQTAVRKVCLITHPIFSLHIHLLGLGLGLS